jgi:hypothetical protein
MIRIKLSSHWRVRRSEWLLALCTFSLGIVYLNAPGLFEPRFFATMLAIGSQHDWGVFAAIVGAGRLTMLLINGAWRASPHLRVLGAQASCLFWAMLFVSAISAERVMQSVGFWFLFFVFDAFSAVDAAGDARMADERARAARGQPPARADGAADASELA